MTVGYQQRARLERMDVTLFNACEEVWSLTNQTFYDWKVDPSDYNRAVVASEKPHYENLHETSPAGPAMPWQFNAYRKVVDWNGKLIAKEMVCSQPKQPSTRPSKQKCCLRKRVLSTVVSKPSASNCAFWEVAKQL